MDVLNQDGDEHKKWLNTKYKDLLELIKNLPDVYHDTISDVFPNIQQTLSQKRDELEENNYKLLIKGNTYSCLTHLLRFLIGNTDLPVEKMVHSKYKFELKKHNYEQKSAVFHFGKAEGIRQKSPIILDLVTEKDFCEFEERLQLTEKTSNGDSESYSKIEIFWPFKFIQAGITLSIDTNLTNRLAEQEMTGLICVTENGVISSEMKNIFLSQREYLSSNNLMIACILQNPDEEEHVKAKLLEDLQTVRPDISEQELCFLPASCINTSKQREMLQSVFYKMYPTLLRHVFFRHYRWISSAVRRLLAIGESFLRIDTSKRTEKMIKLDHLSGQVTILSNDKDTMIQELKDDLNYAIKSFCEYIEKLMTTDERAANLASWEEDDCPRADDSWKVIAKEGCEIIQCRIAQHLNKWESSARIVEGLILKLIQKMEGDLDLDNDQTQQFGGHLKLHVSAAMSKSNLRQSTGPKTSVATLFKSSGRSSFKNAVISKGIGGAVVRDVCFDIDDPKVKSLFKGYKSNTCCDIMVEATKFFIYKTLDQSHLQKAVSQYFKSFSEKLPVVVSDMIEAILKEVDILKNEVHLLENMQQIYQNIKVKCVHLQLQLDMFYMSNLLQQQVSFEDLRFDVKRSIGRGHTFDVYNGQLCSQNYKRQVVIKVSKKSIGSPNTVSDFTSRDIYLRTLYHTNLVKYYGTSIRTQKRGKYIDNNLVLVMEPHMNTLYSHCMGKDYTPPSKADIKLSEDARFAAATYAQQICQGLEYLHSHELIYGCLRLWNIFLTSNDVIKLKDALFWCNDIDHNDDLQIDVYTAPELFCYAGNATSASDMYSLGIVLWELWYAIDAGEHIRSQIFTNLRKSVKCGLRPALSLTAKPPKSWIDMFKSCFEYDPLSRPNAHSMVEFCNREMEKIRSFDVEF